jgi:hypothetical protein
MTGNAASFNRFRTLSKATAAGLGLLTCLVAAERPAHAQSNNANCPPGSWFCAEAAPQGSAQPQGNGNLQQLPPSEAQAAAAQPAPPPPPPPVVVYQPPPPTVVVTREAPPPYVYKAPDWAPRRNEWGMNLHLGGATIGKGYSGDAGMGLIGAGLRFRPVPHAAIEGDLDFAGGRDYNGYRRAETAFTINALFFVNPKDRAQFYFLGGFGWSAAHAVDDRSGYDGREFNYGYFGVQGGVGLEYRAARHVALNLDGRLFVRGRVDGNKNQQPEFVDSSGQSTNASGGGIITGGITFYF